MVVLGDDEAGRGRVVDRRVVEQVGVGGQLGQLAVGLAAVLVDGDDLLVEVVEGGAGRRSQFWKTATYRANRLAAYRRRAASAVKATKCRCSATVSVPEPASWSSVVAPST